MNISIILSTKIFKVSALKQDIKLSVYYTLTENIVSLILLTVNSKFAADSRLSIANSLLTAGCQ